MSIDTAIQYIRDLHNLLSNEDIQGIKELYNRCENDSTIEWDLLPYHLVDIYDDLVSRSNALLECTHNIQG